MMSDYGVGALGGVVLIDPETGLPYKAEGGGGGGAVDSVNGQTGVVVLALDDLITPESPGFVGGGTIAMVDDMDAPSLVTMVDVASVSVQNAVQDRAVTITSEFLRIKDGANSGSLYAPESGGGSITVRLPSESGTLALESQVQAIVSVPAPPAEGEFTLQSVDGVMSWVASGV